MHKKWSPICNRSWWEKHFAFNFDSLEKYSVLKEADIILKTIFAAPTKSLFHFLALENLFLFFLQFLFLLSWANDQWFPTRNGQTINMNGGYTCSHSLMQSSVQVHNNNNKQFGWEREEWGEGVQYQKI